MNESILKDVMEDVLQELKEAIQVLSGLRLSVDALEGKVAGFEQMLKDQQVVIQPPDLDPAFGEIRQLTRETNVAASETIDSVQKKAGEMLDLVRVAVEKKLSEIQTVIDGRLAEQPKPVIRQWRVVLFPESDKAGSYKYFIDWLFGGTVLALLVVALFLLGRQYLDKWHPPAEQPRQSMSFEEMRPKNEFKAAAPVVVRRQALPTREREQTRKKEKKIDSLEKVAIRCAEDFLRDYGAKHAEKGDPGGVVADSFYDIKK